MSRPATDYTNHRWGSWIALRRDGVLHRSAAWRCQCTKCGHEQRVQGNRIARDESPICEGCNHQEYSRPIRELPFTDEAFVRAWQAAANTAAVIATFPNAKPFQIYYAAARLRKNGVPLKKMPKAPADRSAHYEAMRALAQSLLPK